MSNHKPGPATRRLQKLSPEIDLVTLNVRTSVILDGPDHPDPPMVVTDNPGSEGLKIIEQEGFYHYWKAKFLSVVQSEYHDFDAAKYTLPIAHDYRAFSNGAYIGSLFFFRHVEQGPFSKDCRSLINCLESQLSAFLLTRVLYRKSQTPILRGFGEALRSLSEEHPLTSTEHRVAALLIVGEDTESIARELSITPNTVHSHKKHIYRKAGVSSLAELLAKVLSGVGFDR